MVNVDFNMRSVADFEWVRRREEGLFNDDVTSDGAKLKLTKIQNHIPQFGRTN
jgi:hypothetical protein